MQWERLAYIEFRLYFLGEFSRQDLIARFGFAPAGATRDFAQYKLLFPENISFESATKRYMIGKDFRPTFEHVPERVLSVLSHGFGDGGPLVELSNATAAQRHELSDAFTRFGEAVVQRMSEAANLQKVRLDLFSEQFEASTKSSGEKSDVARAESATSAKKLREGMTPLHRQAKSRYIVCKLGFHRGR